MTANRVAGVDLYTRGLPSPADFAATRWLARSCRPPVGWPLRQAVILQVYVQRRISTARHLAVMPEAVVLSSQPRQAARRADALQHGVMDADLFEPGVAHHSCRATRIPIC